MSRLMKADGLKGSEPPKTALYDDSGGRRASSSGPRPGRFWESEIPSAAEPDQIWPDQLWVADITYVPTDAGYLYLSVVLDAFSRRVVGWAMADPLRTELVLDALDMASKQQSPEKTIHHSDQDERVRQALSTPRSPSASVERTQTCARRWGRLGTATIARFVRASPDSCRDASSLSAPRLRPDRRPALEFSTSSKGGIIRTDCTQPLTISRRCAAKRSTT